MKDEIEHSGTIESIDDGHIRVRITQSSACAGCTARSLCQSSESKDKMVDVTLGSRGTVSPIGEAPCSQLHVGDVVTVCGSSAMGRTAVVLAFVVPLVLMVATVAVGIKLMILSEPVSIGLAFAVLAAYYFVLWTQRTRIQRRFVWRIKK